MSAFVSVRWQAESFYDATEALKLEPGSSEIKALKVEMESQMQQDKARAGPGWAELGRAGGFLYRSFRGSRSSLGASCCDPAN